jgi:tol-pal system protein YbgF
MGSGGLLLAAEPSSTALRRHSSDFTGLLTAHCPQSTLQLEGYLFKGEPKTLIRKAITLLLAGAFTILIARPGFAVSKEIISMMQQLDTLQQQMQNLQKTVDSQTAVLKLLVQQTNDNVTSMKATVSDMKEVNQRSLAITSSRFDSMTSQIQQLSASLDETKAQLSKLSDELAQAQRTLQTLNALPAQAGAVPGAGGQTPGTQNAAGPDDSSAQPSPAAPAASIPDPQTLYKSAYSDYINGNYDLAIQGFEQYLENYGQTDLASNAQFYIGDSYYLQKKYPEAVKAYDKCITAYPGGNKMQAAQLKKAYALLAEGQTSAGVRELRSLVRRYPNSKEADLARQRLRRLSVASKGQG